jgi:hypothetical protein
VGSNRYAGRCLTDAKYDVDVVPIFIVQFEVDAPKHAPV